MYELLLFTGGVYKFDEFGEFIDDIGGLIIEMESFKVSRGMYFLSEEIKVLLIVPEKEISEIENYAKNVKGNIESVLMKDEEIEKTILIFEIYKNCKINQGTTKEKLLTHLSSNPDFIQIKEFNISTPHEKEDFSEKISELLTLMEEMNILEKITSESKDDFYKISLKKE